MTQLRANDGGVVRATGAPMAKFEMSSVRPVGGVKDAKEEILLKVHWDGFLPFRICSSTEQALILGNDDRADQDLTASPLH